MQKLLALMVCWCWAFSAAAQSNITRVEYFIDTDPGFGKATSISITPSPNITNASFNVPISNLSTGIHALFIRSQDISGKWSITNNRFFYKPSIGNNGTLPNINKAEYFFDTDPGFGKAINIPLTAGSNLQGINFSANISALPTGVHALFIRSRDVNGKWSITNNRFFYKPSISNNQLPNITYLEYFIDTDPGFGKANAVAINPATDISNLVVPVNISGLTIGDHKLFVRSRSANGYSITNVHTFPIASVVPGVITVNSVTKKSMCAGDSLQVSFDAKGTYNPNNIFNVELSNSDGIFAATPPVIGSLSGIANGIINCKLPQNSNTGNLYRVRIKSTSPVVTGLTGKDSITITDKAAAQVISGSSNVNGGTVVTYTVPAISGSTWQWIVTGGTQISGSNTNSITVQFANSVGSSAAAAIKVLEQKQSGCGVDTSILNVTVYKLNITNVPASTDLCKGNALNITVNADGAFEALNTYTAQLSNAAGSFSSPVNIGSITASGAGVGQSFTIPATIPATITNGTAYRMRIVSSTPSFTGTANSVPIIIGTGLVAPTASVTVQPGCGNGGGTIVITSPSGANITYSIGNGYQTAATFTGIVAGTYKITAKNAAGCVSDTTTLIVNGDSPATASISASGPLTFCKGGSVTLTSSSATRNRWSNGATTQSITVNNSGNYFVTVGSGSCSATSDTVTVVVTPSVTATFATINPICAGSKAPLLPDTSLNGIKGTWSPATVNNTTTGRYLFRPNNGQCSDTTSIEITVNPVPEVTFAPIPPVCDSSAAFTLTGGLPAGGVYTGFGVVNGKFNPALTGLGTYAITYSYTNTSGCAGISQQSITVINCGTPIRYYIDRDKDGYGNVDSSIVSTSPMQGYVTDSTDCNDANAAINPGAAEICGNGIDDNCNGIVDENCGTPITYYIDADKDGYGNADSSIISTSPVQGYVTNSTDCNDANAAINPGAAEICGNGIDDNCNGIVDENCGTPITYYMDADKDGYGNADSSIISTSPVQGYVTNSTDCNDRDATIYPDAPELCDGKDNNCNGQTDEGLSLYTYYKDADNDGYGNDSIFIKTCKPITKGWAAKGGDCNDNNPKVNPGAVELCGNGIDDNCDGQIDENDPKPTLNINSIVVSEDQGKASLKVTLSKESKLPVLFNYRTVNGSAYNLKDYLPENSLQIIPAGKLSINIDITLVKDNIEEPTEYFDVELCNSTNALLGTKTGRVTIQQDSSAESLPQMPANSNAGFVNNDKPLSAKVMPNPSENYFTIITSSGSKESLSLKVVDVNGRLVEIKKGISVGETFRIGSSYRTGIYFVEMMQGKRSIKLKLFKKQT